jgi:hypothetical protein
MQCHSAAILHNGLPVNNCYQKDSHQAQIIEPGDCPMHSAVHRVLYFITIPAKDPEEIIEILR